MIGRKLKKFFAIIAIYPLLFNIFFSVNSVSAAARVSISNKNFYTNYSPLDTNSVYLWGNADGATGTWIQIEGGENGNTIFTPFLSGTHDFAVQVYINQNTNSHLVIGAQASGGGYMTGSIDIVEQTLTGTGRFFGVYDVNPTDLPYFVDAGDDPTSSTGILVEQPLDFGYGDFSVKLGSNTTIFDSDGDSFNAFNLAAAASSSPTEAGLGEVVQGAGEYGIPGYNLYFSKPIQINIPVPGYSGSTIKIKVKHNGESNFGTGSLTNNPDAVCNSGIPTPQSNIATVSGGIATIYTCAASQFEAVGDLCDDEVTTGVPKSECETLEALYDSTDGDHWTNNTNWKTATGVTNWYGVTVTGGHVTKLTLFNNNLTGTIPTELGNLTNLQELYFNYNNLIGTIPTSLENLINLEKINLYHNSLSGTIPDYFGNMSNLTIFSVSANNFTGSIPNTFSSTGLHSLTLSYNNLSGEVPQFSSSNSYFDVYIQSNKFNFNDLIPNFNSNSGATNIYNYNPQQHIDTERTVNLTVGDTLSISSVTTESHNTYEWDKDGSEISGETGSTLNISSVTEDDAGVYTYYVDNTLIPNLRLVSNHITVNISPATTNSHNGGGGSSSSKHKDICNIDGGDSSGNYYDGKCTNNNENQTGSTSTGSINNSQTGSTSTGSIEDKKEYKFELNLGILHFFKKYKSKEKKVNNIGEKLDNLIKKYLKNNSINILVLRNNLLKDIEKYIEISKSGNKKELKEFKKVLILHIKEFIKELKSNLYIPKNKITIKVGNIIDKLILTKEKDNLLELNSYRNILLELLDKYFVDKKSIGLDDKKNLIDIIKKLVNNIKNS